VPNNSLASSGAFRCSKAALPVRDVNTFLTHAVSRKVAGLLSANLFFYRKLMLDFIIGLIHRYQIWQCKLYAEQNTPTTL